MEFFLQRAKTLLLWLVCTLALNACSPVSRPVSEPRDYQPGREEFSVMTYNVHQYAFQDRDNDGQEDDLKPREERETVVDIILHERPDVLCLQEIGSPPVVERFKAGLAEGELVYPHEVYLRHGAHENNMLVLSRFPVISRQSHTDDTYSIGESTLRVARGFIDVDIEVNEEYRFRLLTAHLKSKVYHELGQTEMRRNEARLLNKHVRQALKAAPELNLLVAGDMNDTYGSAALREIMGKRKRYLFDLRPEDYVGDVWTHFTATLDQYERIDYLLVSQGMVPEVVAKKTHAVRWPNAMEASDHRPIVAVFKAFERRLRQEEHLR